MSSTWKITPRLPVLTPGHLRSTGVTNGGSMRCWGSSRSNRLWSAGGDRCGVSRVKTFYRDRVYRIEFQIRARAPDVIDQLAFVYLVQMKFDGKINAAHPFQNVVNGKGRKFISVTLEFGSFEPFNEAKYHCNRNLTDDGEIRSEYLGALDAADPQRLEAKRLHQLALTAPSSN